MSSKIRVTARVPLAVADALEELQAEYAAIDGQHAKPGEVLRGVLCALAPLLEPRLWARVREIGRRRGDKSIAETWDAVVQRGLVFMEAKDDGR